MNPFDDNYIHPNFSPTDQDKYLEVVMKLRDTADQTDDDVIYVTKEEYDILEDAAHKSMKGQGHQIYGKEIRVIVKENMP